LGEGIGSQRFIELISIKKEDKTIVLKYTHPEKDKHPLYSENSYTSFDKNMIVQLCP